MSLVSRCAKGASEAGGPARQQTRSTGIFWAREITESVSGFGSAVGEPVLSSGVAGLGARRGSRVGEGLCVFCFVPGFILLFFEGLLWYWLKGGGFCFAKVVIGLKLLCSVVLCVVCTLFIFGYLPVGTGKGCV